MTPATIRGALEAAKPYLIMGVRTRDCGDCMDCGGPTSSGTLKTCMACAGKRVVAALASIPSSPYDQAVHGVAARLADGWIAQDKDCTITTFFTHRPGRGEWAWTCADSEFEFSLDPLQFPPCEDWNSSLRRIVSGAVVEVTP
jgi:hypothetical protein